MSAQGPHNVQIAALTLCSLIAQCLQPLLSILHNLHNRFLHNVHNVCAKCLQRDDNPLAQGARALTLYRYTAPPLKGARLQSHRQQDRSGTPPSHTGTSRWPTLRGVRGGRITKRTSLLSTGVFRMRRIFFWGQYFLIKYQK